MYTLNHIISRCGYIHQECYNCYKGFMSHMQKNQLTPDVVEINDRATYYWQRNASASEHVVLVLHGFMSDYRSMEPFVEYVDVTPDTRVILPDLPGFGASAVINDDPTVDDYVCWAVKFLETVAPDAKAVTVVGYSFGAYIAIKLAASGRLHMEKLVLITPVVKLALPVKIYSTGFDSLAAVSMRAAHKLYTWQPSFDFTTYYLLKTKDKDRREKLKMHRRAELETLRPELVLNLYRTLDNTNLMPYAADIDVPVVIVMAQKDNVAFNYYTRAFIKKLPGEVATINVKNAGHLMPFEEPEHLADIVDMYGLSVGTPSE
jgi:pimeloyl-ACP methyl ester carboxylesterase